LLIVAFKFLKEVLLFCAIQVVKREDEKRNKIVTMRFFILIFIKVSIQEFLPFMGQCCLFLPHPPDYFFNKKMEEIFFLPQFHYLTVPWQVQRNIQEQIKK